MFEHGHDLQYAGSRLRYLPEQQSDAGARRVLLIMQRRSSDAGYVGRWLRAHGYALDIRRPRFGDPLPHDPREYAGAVIFGGPMSANDPDDYIRREIDWIGQVLAADIPFLGICLGAQLLARQLGARVFQHPRGYVEIGFFPLRPTGRGRELPHWPSHVYQWHREGFELASGMEKLAEGPIFENQAFRYGRAAFGVQFHPEITPAMIERWTRSAHHRLRLPCAQPRGAHIAGYRRFENRQRIWLHHFLLHWTRLARHVPR